MMNKKDHNKNESEKNSLNEPISSYSSGSGILIFKSFEDQENYNRLQMAKLSPLERLQHLRKMINIAYRMHGYDPDKLPVKHSLRFL